MHRRAFLTNLGRLSVVGFAAAILPAAVLPITPQTGSNLQRFKVVGSGRLLVSKDGGRTWQPGIHFGPDVAVTGLSQRGPDTLLALSFQGHAFALGSADGIQWRSLG